MDPAPQSPDEQLAESTWVRRLAQNILRDPALADDAAQESAIAAWRHGPLESHARASWLATTARRLAGRLLRGETRRSARERAAARGEALPSAAELVERAEAHRALVAAVLALEEPYRSTILLRFVEDLPPRAIARRAGIPVATVKTRLARGLERLRKGLEREHRDARQWLGLLVPFTHLPHLPPLVLGSALVKTIKLTAAVLLVLLLATGVFFTLRSRSGAALVDFPQATETAARTPAAERAVEAGKGTTAREGIEPASAAAAGSANSAPPEHERMTGRVLDLAEKPIEGARIQALHSPSDGFEVMDMALVEPAHEITSAESAADGRFALEIPYGMLVELRVAAAGFAEERLTTKFGGGELVVHLGAGAVLTGEVARASDGTPVVGARVRIFAGTEQAVERDLRTDAFGRYRTEGLAPGTVGLIVIPEAEEMTRWEELELAPGQTLRHDIRVGAGESVRGRVLDQRTHAAIAGAEVSGVNFVYKTVKSDAHGEFEIRGLKDRQMTLRARAVGYGQSELRVLDSHAAVELLLAPGRRASGRVLGPDGQPLAGAFVAATAAEYAAEIQRSDAQTARSGADGRFELAELRADLPHVLFVRASGCGALFRAFPAEELQLEAIELGDIALAAGAAVEGRVLDLSGAPRPAAYVWLRPLATESGPLELARMHGRQGLQCDATGRFVFRDLAPGDWEVQAKEGALPEPVEMRLHLSAGEFRRGFDVRLGEGLALEGWVGDESGHALAEAWVTADPEDGSRRAGSQLTDADGRFRMPGLAAGLYTLGVRGPRAESEIVARYEVLRQYHVEAGRAALELRLVARSSSIRGRVLDADGAPLAGAFVWRMEESFPPQEFVLSDAEGRFEIPVAPNGSVQLCAQRGIPLAQALRGPTYSEVRAGRVVVDEEASRVLSPSLAAGSTDVELRLRALH